MPKTDRSADPSLEPVPSDKFSELRNLLTWLYGSKERDLEPAVKSQNPDLGRLREVLSSPTAVIVLAERNNLDEAIITATPVDVRFQRHLIGANAELQHALSTLEGFDPVGQPELQTIADSVVRKANIVKAQVDSAISGLRTE
jgi:hypothetical protein